MAFSVDLSKPNYSNELLNLGLTGAVHYAPPTAALPTKLDAYGEGWVDFGWLSDEGIRETPNEERNGWTPWQAAGEQRSQIATQTFQFGMTVWSISGLANALYYGVAAEDMQFDEGSGIVTFEQGAKLPKEFWFRLGIDVLDGPKHRRYLLPRAKVVERGEIIHTKTDIVGYPMTFQAEVDNELGFAIRRLFKEGWQPGKAGTVFETDNSDRNPGDWSAKVTPVSVEEE